MAMKTFHVPINHPFIQQLTDLDLEFLDWSSALDNPKFYNKMKNTYFDDDFDEFEKEVEGDELTEEEQRMFENAQSNERNISQEIQSNNLPQDDDYIPMTEEHATQIDDWEEV